MKAQHYVVFESPGTFFHETSERAIGQWDPRLAVEMAETIKERYGATPFAFSFETWLVSREERVGDEIIPEIKRKRVKASGRHFLGAKLETVEQIEARGDERERVLVSNMRCNDWPIVAFTMKGWRCVQPFNEPDVVVNALGAIIERGDDPVRIAYRARILAEHRARLGAQS